MIDTKNSRWEPIIHRPCLPEGWNSLEQLDSPDLSYSSYSKVDKIHHNDQAKRLMIIFCQYPPGSDWNFSVRGGRNIKPSEKLKFFNDLKSATDYMIYLMQSTNNWLKEINSELYIQNYNETIQKMNIEN